MYKVSPEDKRTLELNGSSNDFMKIENCNSCATPNCKLPCHHELGTPENLGKPGLIVPILSVHDTEKLRRVATQSKSTGAQIAYTLAILVDKVNEIITYLNKEKEAWSL
jgi:hypothetical protein